LSDLPPSDKVSLVDKLARFDDRWRPRIVARYNGNDVMVVKLEGAFTWHAHPETDDFFLVLAGRLDIALRHRTVGLGPASCSACPPASRIARARTARCTSC
jgi:mannose-6-phosphate isomerase-like protein (cupin superfamily)